MDRGKVTRALNRGGGGEKIVAREEKETNAIYLDRKEKEGGGKKIWKKLWTNGTAARIGFSRAIESKGSDTVRRRAFTLRLSNVYTDERTRGEGDVPIPESRGRKFSTVEHDIQSKQP